MSLPLIMLRGHCQLISGQYPGALRTYFQVCKLFLSWYFYHLVSRPFAVRRHVVTVFDSGRVGKLRAFAVQAFELLPEEPLVNLCLGVGYLLHSTSRIVGDRNSCILKAFAFFTRYAAKCPNPAEAAFNMGRAFHHLELHHLAVEWYERSLVLCMKNDPDDDSGPKPSDGSDVRFECGHNLALIYENSGARELAIRIRFHHCSV